MPRTPSPPGRIRTPPAPRWGRGYDSYEPYSPRKPAKLAGQRTPQDALATPPSFPDSDSESIKDTKILRSNGYGYAPILSPEPYDGSPTKNESGYTGASDQLKTKASSPITESSLSGPATVTDGMLPTPSKTPHTLKKKLVGDIGSTARTLFPATTSSGPNKKSKQPVGYSLESFEGSLNQDQADIKIYTDCRDRVPEIHKSGGNPFYTKPSVVKPARKATTTPASAGRKEDDTQHKEEDIKRDKEVQKSLHRKDGMFYVFRGKKFFRRFDAAPGDRGIPASDLEGLEGPRSLLDSPVLTGPQRLTRSAIRLRLLHAANDCNKEDVASETDEESGTVTEDHGLSKDIKKAGRAEDVELSHDPVTPPRSSTVASSDPRNATVCTPRPRAKKGGAECDVTTPVSTPKKQQTSLLTGWQWHKKSPPSGPSTPRKRDAATISPSGSVTKKTKGNRATLPS